MCHPGAATFPVPHQPSHLHHEAMGPDRLLLRPVFLHAGPALPESIAALDRHFKYVIFKMTVEVNFQARLTAFDVCSLAEPGMTLLMALPG